jgi:hypothetical protein
LNPPPLPVLYFVNRIFIIVDWAAQNKALAALRFLFENYDSVIDVLATNKVGLSTLTEAFNSGDADIISACLEHPTSSEEKLLSGLDKKQFTTKDTTTTEEDDGDVEENEKVQQDVDAKPHGAVDHIFNFGDIVDEEEKTATNTERKTLFLRELPISRADNPFGDESAPEDDTTGKEIKCVVDCLNISPYSILNPIFMCSWNDVKVLEFGLHLFLWRAMLCK